jgi:hypothetical protein
VLKIPRSSTADETELERINADVFFTRLPDHMGYITVRCWGHIRQPITALFEDVQKQISESTKLTVIEMGAHKDKKSQRNKRPPATLDLDPNMKRDKTDEIELFFHKDSQLV